MNHFTWVTHEYREDKTSDNHYNCPVVISYSEIIKNNVPDLKKKNIKFINPFMTLNDKENLKDRLCQVFSYYYADLNISKSEIRDAVDAAKEEEFAYKADKDVLVKKLLKKYKKKT